MRLSDLFEARIDTKTALQQAAADGFDVDKLWYHGTRRRFDQFRERPENTIGVDELGPGVYVTSKKWLANTWAREGGHVLTCVVRKGPLIDLYPYRSGAPFTEDMWEFLHKGHSRAMVEKWGPGGEYSLDMFKRMVDKQNQWRSPSRVINSCLSAVGYVGGYDHGSQIPGQIVVFKKEDIRIVRRQGGKRYMSDTE